MKIKLLKTACVILALLCAASFSSCGKKTANTPADTSKNEDKEEIPVTDYSQKTVSLNKNTEGIKILGVRNLESSTVINADWTCSGIEFYADLEGSLTLKVMSEKPCYYRAYVDGVPYNNGDTPYFTVEGTSSIRIDGIERGKHLFRFIKVTGYTLSNTALRSISLCGEICKKAPEDNGLYLEFVGDSICCGWGVLPDANGEYKGTYDCQDGSLAYPYLISSALGADYSITALSGQGLLCGNPGMTLGYRYACYGKDKDTAYGFERKADAVIINIGTNDYSQRDKLGIDANDFYDSYSSFIKYVREVNGASCKVILVYNMMNDTFVAAVSAAAKDAGGEAAGIFVYTANRTQKERGNSHPSINENQKYAEDIGAFIKQALNIR